MPKPMRLPNGFGNINKLSGNRRKPFRARIFEGYTDDGKKIYRNIGYFEKYNEALTALVEYHKNPLDFQADITFEELYERWSAIKFEKISPSNVNGYKASYKLCESIYKKPLKEIKLAHLQHIADTCGKNYPTLKKLKTFLSQMFEYAVMQDIISNEFDKTEFIDIGSPEQSTKHYRFTDAEIEKIWSWSTNNEYVQMILMMIYSGTRPGEFFALKRDDVNMKEKYIKITDGKNELAKRKVPMYERCVPFFEYWMNKNTEYLVTKHNGSPFNMSTGHKQFVDSYWKPILDEIGIYMYKDENGEMQEHLPHDTRHTFTSMWHDKKLSEVFRRKIQGHSGKGIGEQVYTHIEFEKLRSEINQL